jgi:hypothetical protein
MNVSKKIESLTVEQESRFPEFVEKWTQIGLSSDPADRPRAEKAVRETYARAGLAAPARIVWCGSPLSLGLTRAMVLDKTTGEVVDARVSDDIPNSVWAGIKTSIAESSDVIPGYSFKTHTESNVLMSVQGRVRARVSVSVLDRVWTNVKDSVWDNIADSVGIWDSIRAAVANGVWKNGEHINRHDSFDAHIDGQHDARLLGAYCYFYEVLRLQAETEQLSGLWELAQSAGRALPHQNICWLSERHHILECDEDGLLHSLTGPACAYPDGFSIHAIHGVRVPPFVVRRPREITVQKIDDEDNAEIRRVMIERYRPGEEVNGAAAFMRDGGGKRVDHDGKFGTLWRRELPDDEPIVMLEVVNATRERDGSSKHYWLRVPPTMTTAREAAAWTFDRAPEDYVPSIET